MPPSSFDPTLTLIIVLAEGLPRGIAILRTGKATSTKVASMGRMTYPQLQPYRRGRATEMDGGRTHFFPVERGWVDALAATGIDVPDDLAAFWRDIGYGFLQEGEDRNPTTLANMFLSPTQVRDLLGKKGTLKALGKHPTGTVPFFQVEGRFHLALQSLGGRMAVVMLGDPQKVLAGSLPEFLDRLHANPRFHRDMMWPV